LKAQRFRLLAIVVALISMPVVFQPVVFGNSQAQKTKDTQIEVRLTPKQKSIKVGEILEVRVEIRNVGTKPLFIENEIYNPCVLSPLSLRLELGPPMKPPPGPGEGCAADCVYTAKDSFTMRLVSRWTVLRKGDFSATLYAGSMATWGYIQINRQLVIFTLLGHGPNPRQRGANQRTAVRGLARES
jgi:hypothetical protein